MLSWLPVVLLIIYLLVGLVVPDGQYQVKKVCAGKEFQLAVDSTYFMVMFTPSDGGQKHLLLDETIVKDRRFKWTKDKLLVLKEATHSDQGLYSIGLFNGASGFTYEAVRLNVTDCTKSYNKNYGINFEIILPEMADRLEFFPRGAPSESMPIVLWDRTDAVSGNMGRGRLRRGGKVWVAERVTWEDQGNYTVRDTKGNAMSHSILTVQGHFTKITRHTRDSLNLPLFLPVSHVHLIFTPTQHLNASSPGLIDPSPRGGPIQLIREGEITDHDMRYRGLIYLGMNGTTDVVIIEKLASVHEGLYEIKDAEGNLVSSTVLRVIEKTGKWRALFKSISVPSGMFMSLTGLILFLKRYPCSVSQLVACFRVNHPLSANNPPRVNIQDYSRPDSGHSSHSHHPRTPKNRSPRASPSHTDYTSVSMGTPRSQNQRTHRGNSPIHNSNAERDTSNEEQKISFSLPWSSDCLHASEDCVQFQIKSDLEEERLTSSQECFSTLPLNNDTSESCSVYTSEKLNFVNS